MGLVSALLLLVPACARVLPRQQTESSAVATATAGAPIPLEVSIAPTYASNNAPTATFSANVTTTAATSNATASSLPPKYYKLEFTKGWIDANGNPREAILVNGQTPGPLIEAEEGQELTVCDSANTHQNSADISAHRLKSSTTLIRLALYTLTVSSSPLPLGRMEYRVSRK